jgi:hypothetical protein
VRFQVGQEIVKQLRIPVVPPQCVSPQSIIEWRWASMEAIV